jgi:hypothetical protein
MTFRVWFKNGSSRLVTADSATDAREVARQLAELDALDISHAYTKAKREGCYERAAELKDEWLDCTVVKKVEQLT